MRIDFATVAACATALCIFNSAACVAQEESRQSTAARHAAKARGYADRDAGVDQADVNRSSGGDGAAQAQGKGAGLDADAMNKLQKDIGETFKGLEKALDQLN